MKNKIAINWARLAFGFVVLGWSFYILLTDLPPIVSPELYVFKCIYQVIVLCTAAIILAFSFGWKNEG